MTQDSPTTDEPDGDLTKRLASAALSGTPFLLMALASFILAFSTPVAAAASGSAGSSLMCNGSTPTGLGKVMNFILQSTFSVGLIGAVAMWQYQSLVEIITFDRESRKQAKQQKQRIGMAVLSLIGIGPLAKYGGQAIGVTFSACVDFTPFL
jgi:hypothetical protein